MTTKFTSSSPESLNLLYIFDPFKPSEEHSQQIQNRLPLLVGSVMGGAAFLLVVVAIVVVVVFRRYSDTQ